MMAAPFFMMEAALAGSLISARSALARLQGPQAGQVG